MQQIVKLIAVAAALYPTLVASSMSKVYRRSDILARDEEPVMVQTVNITTFDGLAKRDLEEPPVSYSYTLIGCFEEINNYPVRVFNHKVDWDKVSVSSCVRACFNNGPIDGPFGAHYIYASVINGNECWCDSTINVQAQKVENDRCNRYCENGPNEYCGGSREYQTYFLGQTALNPYSVFPSYEQSVGIGSATYSWQGCYLDSHSSRALNGWSFTSVQLTPQRCTAKCWEQGYTWAGVEYGQECWCGNENLAAGPAIDTWNCNQVCNGDSTLTCGAPNYIELYHTSYPSRLTLPNIEF